MTDYQDNLDALNRNIPLRDKLVTTHQAVQAYFPFVARIAVAVYDPKTTTLRTYLHSSGGDDPLPDYQATLAEAPSLERILREGRPRVINNMVTFERGTHEHTRRIGRQGYAASYTMPMFSNGVFFGFLFFNSYERDVFTGPVLHQLDVFGHMIALMVINELAALRTLVAAVTTTARLTHVRDPETGSHLDRMSRYARLIAHGLAARHKLDDEYIERVFMFAPLHDIGKIGIPDRIQARRGRELVDELLMNFGLDAIQHVDILRNIAEFHHEAMNGGGYPRQLKGEAIPLEARIVAVADVFDALTSQRPYKDAWSNEEAFATLGRMAGEQLDAECVAALIAERPAVEQIQAQFRENPLG
jgi:HD-GYP domain-containing protein (c-di-GMP phosphodiesterase class II)